MTSQEKIRDLYQILVNVQSVEDCDALLDDLCTKKEVEKMAERIYAARLLLQGKTYTLKLNYSINGTAKPEKSVTKTCR